jgi:hypothetical protein
MMRDISRTLAAIGGSPEMFVRRPAISTPEIEAPEPPLVLSLIVSYAVATLESCAGAVFLFFIRRFFGVPATGAGVPAVAFCAAQRFLAASESRFFWAVVIGFLPGLAGVAPVGWDMGAMPAAVIPVNPPVAVPAGKLASWRSSSAM